MENEKNLHYLFLTLFKKMFVQQNYRYDFVFGDFRAFTAISSPFPFLLFVDLYELFVCFLYESTFYNHKNLHPPPPPTAYSARFGVFVFRVNNIQTTIIEIITNHCRTSYI